MGARILILFKKIYGNHLFSFLRNFSPEHRKNTFSVEKWNAHAVPNLAGVRGGGKVAAQADLSEILD
jgi:hypothetical protein